MSHGEYLSLEEARKETTMGATIKRFCKEHPTEGDEPAFDRLLGRMTKTEKKETPD